MSQTLTCHFRWFMLHGPTEAQNSRSQRPPLPIIPPARVLLRKGARGEGQAARGPGFCLLVLSPELENTSQVRQMHPPWEQEVGEEPPWAQDSLSR